MCSTVIRRFYIVPTVCKRLFIWFVDESIKVMEGSERSVATASLVSQDVYYLDGSNITVETYFSCTIKDWLQFLYPGWDWIQRVIRGLTIC